MNWLNILLKVGIVALFAFVAYYLTSGSNIATVATIGAIALGIWFVFIRKGGLNIGKNDRYSLPSPGKNGASPAEGERNSGRLATA